MQEDRELVHEDKVLVHRRTGIGVQGDGGVVYRGTEDWYAGGRGTVVQEDRELMYCTGEKETGIQRARYRCTGDRILVYRRTEDWCTGGQGGT